MGLDLADRHSQTGFQIGLQALTRQLGPGSAPALEAYTLRLPAVVPEGHIGAALLVAGDLESDCGPKALVFGRISFWHALPFHNLAGPQGLNHHRALVGKRTQVQSSADPLFYQRIRRPPFCEVMLFRQCQVSEEGFSLDAEAMCDLRVPGHATHQCTGRARAVASVALAELEMKSGTNRWKPVTNAVW